MGQDGIARPASGIEIGASFGIIGDIHGNFTALDRVLRRHPDVSVWLCVGDVASLTGAYPTPAAPLYWIKGNNEDFDRIEAFRAGSERVENLHYIPNGVKLRVDGLSVAGVGGTFAPTWYDTPAAALPAKSKKDDKRRHFVREEVEACKRLGPVDVLLTHEAPKPFFIDLHPTAQTTRGGGPGLPSSTAPSKRWRRDVGKPALTEVADVLRPRLHCFGHHHVHASFVRDGVPTVCVDRVNRSYLLVDATTFEWTVHATGE